MECESRPGLGCLVFGTTKCAQRRSRWRRWMSIKLTVELWWVILALVPVVFLSSWLVELFRGSRPVTET